MDGESRTIEVEQETDRMADTAVILTSERTWAGRLEAGCGHSILRPELL